MIYGITSDSEYGRERADDAIQAFLDELERAEMIHPGWPSDPIHGASVMVEEAGEALREANDIVYADGSYDRLRQETIQAGAMAIRLLMHLPEVEHKTIYDKTWKKIIGQ